MNSDTNAGLAVALIEPKDLIGEALLELIEARLPVTRLFALTAGAEGSQEANLVFQGQTMLVEALEGFDFSKVDLVFINSKPTIAARYGQKAVDSGCIVIDHSGHFSLEEAVPLVVADLNLSLMDKSDWGRVVASPGANSVSCAMALKPILDLADITRVDLVLFQSVANAGAKGIASLAQQTEALLSSQPIKKGAFTQRIAFNVIPQVGAMLQNGYSYEELRIVAELRKILGTRQMAVNPTTAWLPVFYGDCAAIHVKTNKAIDLQALKRLYQQSTVVLIDDDDLENVTPAGIAEDPHKVFLGRIRLGLSSATEINLWAAADPILKSSALNCIQIAEYLLKNKKLICKTVKP